MDYEQGMYFEGYEPSREEDAFVWQYSVFNFYFSRKIQRSTCNDL